MNWTENWNPDIGLWTASGPGHTIVTKNLDTLHPGTNAATRLVVAAQQDALDQIDVLRVLQTLKSMQVTEPGNHQGCMKWYWEEDRPYDTNAAFFTGLSLTVLRIVWPDKLDDESRSVLNDILQGLNTWFQNAVAHKTFYYPNKYLGDLVCAWLLLEIFDRVDEDTHVADTMREAAAYWRDNGWGWGEHLSDGYTSVCLDELSALLMLSEQLPADLHDTYLGLLNDLLFIEDAFDDGPRVPALRSYAFLEPRSHVHFRDQIRPWAEGESTGMGNRPLLGNLLHTLGWHDLVAPRQTPKTNITVPCFNGAIAHAHLEPDCRIGSVSRFPVMPPAEYPTWGLAWQSFPVAFWHKAGDWGFLQWETIENDAPRSHPAQGRHMAHQPKTLTESVWPPIVGQTHAIQHNSDLLVLRIMPAVTASWTEVADRFRLINPSVEATIEKRSDLWHQLTLPYHNQTLSVHHLAFIPCKPERIANDMNGFDWQTTWPHDQLQHKRALINLWAFSLGNPITEPPDLRPIEYHLTPQAAEERAYTLHWQWPNTTWHVHIDPRSPNPLTEL